jgi:hypothetical protein
MPYVIAAPEIMATAATDLAGIGSDLSAAHTAAAAPTVGLVPAAADEVSAGIAHLFSSYSADFHGLAGRAAVFHEQFLGSLRSGATSYASAEAANIETFIRSLLQNFGQDVLVPAATWLLQTFGADVLVPALLDLVYLNIKIYQFWHGPGTTPVWLRQLEAAIAEAFKNLPPGWI